MRLLWTILAAMMVATAAVTPAYAATGEVDVFSTELQPLARYANPHGCYQLPITAHVLMNLTSSPVILYADPFCAGPAVLMVRPSFGSHVVGFGSFAAR